MTTQESTTSLARSLQHQHPLRAALFVLFLGPLLAGHVCEAGKAADPYDALHDVLMTRYAKDGKSYAENESSPVILLHSSFPFDDRTYGKFTAALDAFGALPQERIEAYSDIKRALLQRHLWKVFDVTYPDSWRLFKDRRAAAQPRIASLIQRLALTREEILALPDTRTATVVSGGFARCHDPADQYKPFLPADLYSKDSSKDSSWICLGESKHPIPASLHTKKLTSRSTFLQFMSLPEGRRETLNYIQELHRHDVFPAGTRVALIEQAFLISEDRELILSPLIVSIQLRAYLDVNRSARQARPEPTQCVAEFVMQPRELMKGNAIMKAMDQSDYRFEAGQVDCGNFSHDDPFEKGPLPTVPRLDLCMKCHGEAGNAGGGSILTAGFLSPRSPEAIGMATSAQKRDDRTWKALCELWKADTP